MARHPGTLNSSESSEDGKNRGCRCGRPVECHPSDRGSSRGRRHHEKPRIIHKGRSCCGLQRVDANAAKDVGRAMSVIEASNGPHQHAERRDEQGDPLVAVVGNLPEPAGEVARGGSQGQRAMFGQWLGPGLPFTWTTGSLTSTSTKGGMGEWTDRAADAAPANAVPQVQCTLNRY